MTRTQGVLDHAFIAEHTNGYEAFAADLRATAWPSIETVSGFSRTQLGEVAAAYAKSNATIVTYGMGITQHMPRHRTMSSRSQTCCC